MIQSTTPTVFWIEAATSAKSCGHLGCAYPAAGSMEEFSFSRLHQDIHSCPHRIVKAAGVLL